MGVAQRGHQDSGGDLADDASEARRLCAGGDPPFDLLLDRVQLPARDWQIQINALLGDFFDPDPEEELELQGVRDALDRLGEQALAAELDEPLPVEVVAVWLAAVLAQAGTPHRFLTGRVTFCNLVPMRSVPFRVVCLLGLNDTDFPRNQRPTGLDLIARHPRRGDRSRRRDDRYLFLEALLSARDRLYLSYVGQDIRDNSLKASSVLATELLDYLARSFRLPGDDDLLDRLVVRHPLQPFSPRYFDPAEPRLYSFADGWVVGELIFREHAAATAAFVERVRPRLREPGGEPLELDLAIGAYRLRGWLPTPAPGVGYRLGHLRAKDRLGAWVRHLACCALTGGSASASVYVAEDKTLFLNPVADARTLLEDLLDAYRQGLREPLAFFPETSLAWAEQEGFSDKVWNAWAGDYNAFAESLDPAVAIAWRGRNPFESNAFADLAARVYAPMLAAAALIPAAKDRP